ncbi:E3 ubiquitin-protein ligase RNFT1 isoform X2 [Anolis carolinensis]|uniref:E3 ubiquitin-protein ligase RNFT1 isoform X2 n=1 Tax=Anolis carolinensis TaxID=28377 RepID=UPI002F2B4062
MKCRPRHDRFHSSLYRSQVFGDQHTTTQELGAGRHQLDAMQPNANNRHGASVNGDGTTSSQSTHAAALPGEGSCQHIGDVHIQLGSVHGETGENVASRHHPRLGSQSRPHSHSDVRDTQGGGGGGGPDLEEQNGSSFSEFRYLLQWLYKSLPYLLILSIKLLTQHLTGISLGIGLLTTFMYANKSIVNQVFLRERHSRLQCVWLLSFLVGSSLLIYYTFYYQCLHYSLIFLSPNVVFMSFWEVLWIVGITDFVLKFLFMSFKCIVLLLPSFIMSFKSKGYCYMFLEEFCQFYRTVVPIPVWFQYLVGFGELHSMLGWCSGVLLALLYLVLKLLGFFGSLKNLRRVLRVCSTQPSYGTAASKRQCAEAEDICAICQAEFRKPVLLICQHIFCDECIALWFNREKTCPLCRTVISDHVNKWKDGATSAHLQVY